MNNAKTAVVPSGRLESSGPRWSGLRWVLVLPVVLLSAAWSPFLRADEGPPASTPSPPPPAQTQYTQQSAEELQRLVAPIALYPDSLVAQVLAASTFPDQVVQADRWLLAHPELQGEDLGKAVDSQAWDPSVKALTAFASVMGNMDKNLAWTSSLGDAYYNQQAAVMDAVQTMRKRAQAAGTLQTTPQQTVATQDASVVIQPADPEMVYVPAYDPWLAYGDPVLAWPGWYPYPGIWYDGPALLFGVGFGLAYFGGFGWGWGHWGFDWRGRYARYDNARYYSRSSTFYNRGSYYRSGGARGVQSSVTRAGGANHSAGAERSGGAAGRSGARAEPFAGQRQAARGYAAPHGESGVRSGAFSGYDRGGQTRSFSARGGSSFGGGAARGGGGGAIHGGGGRGR